MSPSVLPQTTSMNLTPRFNYSSGGLTLASPSTLEGQQHPLMSKNTEFEQGKVELDEHESKSGSDNMEGGSGEDQGSDQPPRKKRYHRHSVHQIQQMESFFKECPHPDEKQRQQLSNGLGLSTRQVKFWFQNRRTQLKSQQERQENNHLRADNERMRAENITMREAIKNASCPNCGGPSTLGELSFDEQRLAMENARLREELNRISSIVVRYFGGRSIPSLTSLPPISSSSLELGMGSSLGLHPGGPQGEILSGPSVAEVALRPGGLAEREKPLVVELAVASLDELHRMARAEEPLWLKSPNGAEILDYDAYLAQFPTGIGPRPFGLKTEASREMGLVIMNGLALVDALMDANKWVEMFPSVVSKAVTVEVLSPGMGATRDGALQLMYAELQVLSPLVGGREMFFLRYCKQTVDNAWIVVDVSVDSLRENPPPSLMRCRRRPSGCLIQDMPNGYAQVTWVEHVEADDHLAHRIFRPLINSGAAFGAKRWLATLQRHCESLASLLATNLPTRELGVIPSAEGRRGMLKLAEKVTRSFCSNVSATSCNSWYPLPNGDDNIHVMTRENSGNVVLLCAATSLWLPFSRQRVFDFLRDERFRAEWDVLANGPVQEMCHIAKGQHPGNSVSLLRVNASNPNQTNVLFVQESSTDASCSIVVYAPLDFSSLSLVLQGEDASSVLIIPSGFVILPDGPENRATGLLLGEGSIGIESPTSGGCILTVFFQIAVSHLLSSARLNLESVSTVSNVIITTVQNIKAFLQRGDF